MQFKIPFYDIDRELWPGIHIKKDYLGHIVK